MLATLYNDWSASISISQSMAVHRINPHLPSGEHGPALHNSLHDQPPTTRGHDLRLLALRAHSDSAADTKQLSQPASTSYTSIHSTIQASRINLSLCLFCFNTDAQQICNCTVQRSCGTLSAAYYKYNDDKKNYTLLCAFSTFMPDTNQLHLLHCWATPVVVKKNGIEFNQHTVRYTDGGGVVPDIASRKIGKEKENPPRPGSGRDSLLQYLRVKQKREDAGGLPACSPACQKR
ncbi:hypothetical protein ACQKWADRAFT_119337 [Trichoderma austrokoningii]